MPHTPTVSIIIAAYNAARYIHRCLDSIQAQTFKDFEVIIVDDGSNDGTNLIIDEYAAGDSRFKAIHKPNGGVASARQTGLDAVRGFYSIHVDADDWVEPEMLEEMVGFAMEGDYDMVMCDYWEVYPDHVKYNSQKPISNDRRTCFGLMLNSLSGSLCNKLIRHSCYLTYKISFDPEVRMEEDKLVCLKLLAHPIRVSHIGKAYYHYDHTQNADSLCNRGNYSASRVLVLEKISDYCDVSAVKDYFDSALFYMAYESIAQASISNMEFKGVYHPYYRDILRAKGFPLRNRLVIILKMFGISVPVKVIKALFNHR